MSPEGRDRQEREDRRRVVHELLREARGARPARERLDVGELAGLISGSLFAAERRAAEDQLMSSATERERVERVRRDFDLGLVPLPRRRSKTESSDRAPLPARLVRRHGLAFLSLLVFAAVVTLPFSVKRWLEGSPLEVPETMLVLDRVGTPVIVERGARRPTRTGTWLAADEMLGLETGDLVDGLARDGSVVRLDVDGARRISGPDPLLAELHRAARTLGSEAAQAPGLESLVAADARAFVVHPRGRVWNDRPAVEWIDVERRPARVRIERADGELVLEARAEEGRWSFPAAAVGLSAGHHRVAIVERGSGEVVAAAPFEVAAAAESAEVERALFQLEGRFGRGSHLLRAVLLSAHGFFSEARAELEEMRLGDTENPVPVRWLERVWAQLGVEPLRLRMAELSDKRADPVGR